MYKKLLLMIMALFIVTACQTIPTDTDMENSEVVQTDATHNDTVVDHEENEASNPKKEANNNDTLSIHYMDVGQGDATLFTYRGNDSAYTILYDTGDWLGSEVVPYLKEQDIEKIDIVVISHPHADHIGQLKGVMNNFDVDEVWMTGNPASSTVYTEAMESVINSDANFVEPHTGDVFDVGPLSITILHPKDLTADLNSDSLSIRLAFKETAFVMTGDAYVASEQLMMNTGLDLSATVLQLGHHGSNTSSSESFIDKVHPEYAIYSAGIDNTYGHPHQEVVSLFEKKGIALYGTDQYGTIIVSTDGYTTEISTEKEPSQSVVIHDEQNDSHESTTEQQDDCININTATKEALKTIIHIGDARADDIIATRPFNSVDELISIRGIGDVRLAEMKEKHNLCIGGNEG